MEKINITELIEARIRKIIREEIEIWWKEMIKLGEESKNIFHPPISSFSLHSKSIEGSPNQSIESEKKQIG